MENKFNCNFCNKNFSTKSNLNNHLKKARYCIKDRENSTSSEVSNEEVKGFVCQCKKTFTTKYRFEEHISKCKLLLIQKIDAKTKENESLKKNNVSLRENIIKKDTEIQNLQDNIKDLQNIISDLQKNITSIALEGVRKPTTNTTNTSTKITNILAPLDLTEAKIQDIVENHLDESYFLDAQKGMAKFCFDKLIKTEDGKRRLVCSDPVRERYRYLDEDGNIQEDILARQFIEKVSKPLIEVSKKVHEDIRDKYHQIKEDIKRGIEKEISDYLIDIKEKYAEKCLIDIHDIPFESLNRKFRKELAYKSNK